MNKNLDKLHSYPFEKLAQLFCDTTPPQSLAHIPLSIGEPKHPAPQFVADAIINNIQHLATYPSTKGLPALRESIATWTTKRFNLDHETLCPEQQVLPVNGTREALFSFAQAVIDDQQDAIVISPNPFYQIYEGAAFLAGATPYFLPCLAENNFIPDFDSVSPDTWQRCQLIYLCSPGNPTGAVIDAETLKKLIALSDEHDFVIASDECYSEIYFDEAQPPVGLLEACQQLGRTDFRNCVVFHSLSKRSNLPGLRSGFVAGDAALLKQFLRYRTYHGCAMPVQHQIASIAAWDDECHVQHNRALYREKFDAVLSVLEKNLNVTRPDAGFYLWPETPIDDKTFSRNLFHQQHVTVLPGQFLSRTVSGLNPGQNRIRMALVAPITECIEAANRINRFLEQF